MCMSCGGASQQIIDSLGQNSAMGNRIPTIYAPTLQGEPPKTTLFRQEPNGTTYRIPSLVYISECHTFLAFAEKRRTPRDCDAKILVMRRGTQQNGSIQWSPSQELTTACLPEHRTMNPCPVYERESKTLFLFFICVFGNITEGHQISTDILSSAEVTKTILVAQGYHILSQVGEHQLLYSSIR
ncbi:sialidase-3 isoform X3 [Electrophorus electricus]|uniref:sialidase-3 isoform X3 n=1 Tax=Electrophorus electricus TaxID=8005 RepID=UPI0015D097F9|nr:sialidase-3 isoform X3 [Electrophorus electricus]